MVASRLGLPAPGGHRPSARPRPAAARRGASKDTSSQEHLLQVALAHAEAARALYEEGALDMLSDPRLVQIAQAVKDVIAAGGRPDAAGVMNHLDDPALHSVVSRLAEKLPLLPSGEEAVYARDTARRMQLGDLDQRLSGLSRQIAEAEPAGDGQRVAELQAEKSELRKQRRSLLNTGKD